jgi:hypothetical protein
MLFWSGKFLPNFLLLQSYSPRMSANISERRGSSSTMRLVDLNEGELVSSRRIGIALVHDVGNDHAMLS